MSRASKVFVTSSAVLCAASIWGVHWLQERESDTMYQGVIKDEARMRAKALASSSSSSSSSSQPSSKIASSSTAALPPLTAGPSLLTGASNVHASSASFSSTPSPPTREQSGSIGIAQPAPVIADGCETCRISPPPQLLESQSAEQRRMEREARQREYEEQKGLARRLEDEQGVSVEPSALGRIGGTKSSTRLV